jgi:hypothetical protein
MVARSGGGACPDLRGDGRDLSKRRIGRPKDRLDRTLDLVVALARRSFDNRRVLAGVYDDLDHVAKHGQLPEPAPRCCGYSNGCGCPTCKARAWDPGQQPKLRLRAAPAPRQPWEPTRDNDGKAA